MHLSPLIIMQNDSLAAVLSADHRYKHSLVGDSLAGTHRDIISGLESDIEDSTSVFFDKVVDFFANIPLEVYIILGIFILAALVYWMWRKDLFKRHLTNPEPDFVGEDIYQVDYEHEMEEALRSRNYAALVRLVYLRTLLDLDGQQRIAWRIYKTPSQFASECQHPAFSRMTQVFLRVRYGQFPADKKLYEEMTQWRAALQEGGGS